MSDEHQYCDRVAEWLLDPDRKGSPPELSDHLESCASCRDQLWIHQSILAAFVEEEIPELSPGFEAGLERKMAEARVEVRSLSGWRRAALIAYGVVALCILGWALRGIELPGIELSAPWVPVAAFGAVPLTLALAAAASRWLPAPKGRLGPSALGL